MSFLTGKQKETTPPEIQRYRQDILRFVGERGLGTALTGVEPSISLGPLDIEAQRAAFAQRRSEALAQAKESAGTLTGSGFANILGATAGRSVAEENVFLSQLQEQRAQFLADLMERSRQGSAQRFLSLIGAPASFSPQPGTAYQPGFLDYLFQGIGAAAPLFG